MKHILNLVGLFVSAFLLLTACSEEQVMKDNIAGVASATQADIDLGLPGGTDSVDASGNVWVERNLTLSSSNTYYLHNYFRIQSGYTITIEAGTTIYGVDAGESSDDIGPGTLVIEQGAKIDAQGTASSPIVFTSEDKTPGDWGGIIILGEAIACPGTDLSIEGLPTPNNTGYYGGTTDTDNSGIMKYVVIEYGGNIIGDATTSENEINGLTLGAVGSGTTLDYIEVRYNLDDGFEFFGGSVSATHLVSVFNGDDDFDTDQGWSGTIQYAVAIRIPDASHLSTSDSGNSLNGTETNGDNDDCSSGFTTGNLVNVTFVGPYQNNYSGLSAGYINSAYTDRKSAGMNVRDLSHENLYNCAIIGMHKGVYTSSDETLANQFNTSSTISSGLVDIHNTVIIVPSDGDPCDTAMATYDGKSGSTWNSTFTTSGLDNYITQATSYTGSNSMAGVAGLNTNAWDAVAGTMPNLVPQSNSYTLINTGIYPPVGDQVDYCGAFEDGETSWMTGWTNWD